MSRSILLGALLVLLPAPAQAFCSYHGKLYAKTTLEQEFHDARWVVRARWVSDLNHWPNSGNAWTLYRLKLVERFKGDLPTRFSLFTMRNSGGFYLEDTRGAGRGADFLLFLTPYPPSSDVPRLARRALGVNYPCGQSRRWSELKADEVRRLRILAGERSSVVGLRPVGN